MNIANKNRNRTAKNQYFTSQGIIAHLKNYYKLYGLLFIFFLAVFFLWTRKNPEKNSKGSNFYGEENDNIVLAKPEMIERTKIQQGPLITDKTSEQLPSSHKEDSQNVEETAALQKKDWLEIQKDLAKILEDINQFFSWTKRNQTLSKDRIFPKPIELTKYPIIQKLMDLNKSRIISSQFTKKIGDWEIEISYDNIRLTREEFNAEGRMILHLQYDGSWFIDQEKCALSVDTRNISKRSITLDRESVTELIDGISFTGKSGVRWQCAYQEINTNGEKGHKSQILFFFQSLKSAIEPELQVLIDTLKKN